MARKISPSGQYPTKGASANRGTSTTSPVGSTSGNKTAGSTGHGADSPAAGRGSDNPYNAKQITSQRKEPPKAPSAPAGAPGATSGNSTSGSSARSGKVATSTSGQTLPLTKDQGIPGPGYS
jgi:hypothetical protein